MSDILAGRLPLPGWADGAVNLLSPRLGGEALRCSDDSFAAMARMLQDETPVFRPGVFDDFGKWMDGWESKRRRDGGHDWCVMKLGCRGRIRGFDVDTSHFTGNYPPAAAIFAADTESEPGDGDWVSLVPSLKLGPSAQHFVPVADERAWRWLRLDIHPDGGIARLRAYGDPVPDWSANGDGEFELSAIRNGGRVLAFNDAHYGDVWAVLAPGRGRDMGDGWETRRRREPGFDWLIVALGAPGRVTRIEVDTAHFRGNFPDACSVSAARLDPAAEAGIVAGAMFWDELMPRQKLRADHVHVFEGAALRDAGPVSHLRLDIHPDGGVSRFRVFGTLA